MSRVWHLIEELCPGGVEHLPLGEIFNLRGGYTPSKTDADAWANGTVPWFRMEDIRANGRVLGQALQAVNEAAVTGGRLFPANSILVATSATIGEHALVTVPHLSNQRFTSLSLKPTFADRLDMRFVYYYCFVLGEWCRGNTTTSSFASVDIMGFKRFKFPIPPLAIQREIVSILDKMERLESELESELELRTRQYAFYRRRLLTFGEHEDVPWRLLGEVADNHDSRRRPVTKASREPGDVPYYGASGIVDYVRDYIFDGDYLLVSEDGANLLARSTPIAFSATGKTWINNHAHVLELETYAERRFLEFYLNSIDLAPFVSGAAQPKLNKANLNRIPVPQPSMEKQERIVAILDKFEALANDLSVGLPAEIAARRRQYEYYRDKLLTFPEKKAS